MAQSRALNHMHRAFERLFVSLGVRSQSVRVRYSWHDDHLQHFLRRKPKYVQGSRSRYSLLVVYPVTGHLGMYGIRNI